MESLGSTEEKTLYKLSIMFFKGCGISEQFYLELPQVSEGCFEYRFIQILNLQNRIKLCEQIRILQNLHMLINIS